MKCQCREGRLTTSPRRIRIHAKGPLSLAPSLFQTPPAERAPSPATKEKVHKAIRRSAKAGSRRVEKTAIPQTNPSVNKLDNRHRLPMKNLAYPARNDAKTEEGRVVDETDIQQTHSAEQTQSQARPPINIRSDHFLPLR